jgi:hypothetical protein
MSRYVLIVDVVLFQFLIFLTFHSCVVCNKYLDLKFEQVMVGHEEWCDTNTCVNTRIQAVRQELENSQKATVDVDAEVEDINKLYEEKGPGPHLLLIDLEQTTPNAVQYPKLHEINGRIYRSETRLKVLWSSNTKVTVSFNCCSVVLAFQLILMTCTFCQ